MTLTQSAPYTAVYGFSFGEVLTGESGKGLGSLPARPAHGHAPSLSPSY